MSLAAASPDASKWNAQIVELRAWAVAAIVLFHFGVPGFGAGFLGVDVFFVVSGFLMAERVVPLVMAGRFALTPFLLARARRTIPALVLAIATLLVLGWFFLPPSEFRRLAKHAAASASLLSNHVYLIEGGYFDVDAAQKWLLHTWSLAVEWQFYLLFPLLVLGASSLLRRRRWVWGSLGVIALLSALRFLQLCSETCDRAYFGLDTRLWQPLTGVLAYALVERFAGSRRGSSVAAACGLCLLVLAMVLGALPTGVVTPPRWLPHAAAAFGAALCLVSSRYGRAAPLLGTGWLGEASYGLYIWHWPLVVGLGWLELGADRWWVAAGLLASVALGVASARWVERGAQSRLKQLPARIQVAWLAGLPGLLFGLACVVYVADGLPSRVGPAVLAMEAAARDTNPRRDECFLSSDRPLQLPACRFGGPGPIGAVLIGDSHADAVVGALGRVAGAHGSSIVFHGYSGCPPVTAARRLDRPENRCDDFVEAAAREMAKLPQAVPVVLVARWTVYLDGYLDRRVAVQPLVDVGPAGKASQRRERYLQALVDTMCQHSRARPVYALMPVPEMPQSVPQRMARSSLLGDVVVAPTVSRDQHDLRHAAVHAAFARASVECGVHLLDPRPLLCVGGRCTSTVEGRAIYYDDHHLSEAGNHLLEPLFGSVFNHTR